MELCPQDAAHGIVEARFRDNSRFHLRLRIGGKPAPSVRCHIHVEASQQGCGAIFIGATIKLGNRVPRAGFGASYLRTCREKSLANLVFG
jgi:hypothetical protein